MNRPHEPLMALSVLGLIMFGRPVNKHLKATIMTPDELVNVYWDNHTNTPPPSV